MWSCVRRKTPWKVNLNGILNDWDRISGQLQNSDLKIKVKLSFKTTFFKNILRLLWSVLGDDMVALIINKYLEGTGLNPVEALSFLGLLFLIGWIAAHLQGSWFCFIFQSAGPRKNYFIVKKTEPSFSTINCFLIILLDALQKMPPVWWAQYSRLT